MANVLIVDDSYLMRNKLRVMLTTYGHQVVAEAENGVQAVRRFKEFCPDFLTMDITMPEMDGITAVKKILEIDRNAKIIMLSAISQKLLVLEALRAGAKHFIVKPVDEARLKQVVHEITYIKPPEKRKEPEEPAKEQEKPADAPKAEDSKAKEPEVEAYEAVTFDNIDSEIVVTITKEPLEENVQAFALTMAGILNIRHVKLLFDFKNINSLSRDFSERTDRILEQVSSAGGGYALAPMNEKLRKCLKDFNLKYFK